MSFVQKFVYRGEMKGSETSDGNFIRKKSCYPTRTLDKLSIIDEKMLPLTGKIEKGYLVHKQIKEAMNLNLENGSFINSDNFDVTDLRF